LKKKVALAVGKKRGHSLAVKEDIGTGRGRRKKNRVDDPKGKTSIQTARPVKLLTKVTYNASLKVEEVRANPRKYCSSRPEK